MRCEDFEKSISAYLDGELGSEETRLFERHMLICPPCGRILRGVHQVRLALRGLGAAGLPASIKLRLSNGLQEDRARFQQFWIRPLALGLAFAVALAILLWPEPDQEEELVSYWRHGARADQVQDWESTTRPWPENVWAGGLLKPIPPGPYSHALARTVSY